MNNLRTVTRLGVDKFISSTVVADTAATAYELANTLRLKQRKKIIYPLFLKGGGDISTLEKRVTFLCWVDILFLRLLVAATKK
jgi:hypothetical protein